MRFAYQFGLGAALWAALSFPAVAQLSCAPREAVIERLARGYGERLNASGTTESGALVELYKSHDGKSWSLVLALPDGHACLVATGSEWRRRKAPPPRIGKGA